MAWFNKEGKEVPNPEAGAEVKPVEKTAAELIAESLSGFESRITEKFNQFGERVTAIEESTRRPAPAVEPTETPSVFNDENAAFNARIGPVAMRTLEIEARQVVREIRDEYIAAGFGDMWTQFAGEINKSLGDSPLVGANGQVIRGNPDYIRNTVDMIFGRAARQKGVKFNGKDQSFFLESAGGDGGSGGHSVVEDGLTDKQRRIFARMGIKPEDGVKARAKLEFIN